MSTAAWATFGCEIVSGEKGATVVSLLEAPDLTSKPVSEVPLGDIVRYFNQELAPKQVEGWAWVRHDPEQMTFWQTGPFGWLREENLADCG